MNSTLKTLLNHRSIREQKLTPLDEGQVQLLFQSAIRSATSNGMQRYSMIRISDPTLKSKIAELCHQDYINRTPLLIMFVVDTFRNAQIALAKGEKRATLEHIDKFIEGFSDTMIAAQSMVVAAESMGLGTFYIGSVLNDPEQMIELLKLPKLTMPVVGLAIGQPNQEPNLKPRMDAHLRIFENHYTQFDDYLKELEGYDREMQSYYDLRNQNRRVDAFSDQVVTKYQSQNTLRQSFLKVLIKQGFNLHLDEDSI